MLYVRLVMGMAGCFLTNNQDNCKILNKYKRFVVRVLGDMKTLRVYFHIN